MAQNQPLPPILDELPALVIFGNTQGWLPFWGAAMVDGPQEGSGVAGRQTQETLAAMPLNKLLAPNQKKAHNYLC